MSDTEEPVAVEITEEPAKVETENEVETNKIVEEVKAKKKGRGHRVISDEERVRLKEQLARGRATAMENRKKKKLAKQLLKEDKEKEIDDKIIEGVVKKRKAPLDKELADLKDEIAKLKAERAALSKPRSPSPPPKPPSPVVQEKPIPVQHAEPTKPKPAPAPPKKKVFKTKNKGVRFF
jgi:hypothetical protein